MALETRELEPSTTSPAVRPHAFGPRLQARPAAWQRLRQRLTGDTSAGDHANRIGQSGELLALHHAVLGLPLACRRVYLLHRIEGMNCREIARHCDLTTAAVEKNIGDALRLIRERLQPTGNEST